MSASRPKLEAPLTGQALRQCVALHETAQWNAYAQALRVAGYRVDAGRLAEQLMRAGCACVEDAFGHEVTVQVRVPAPIADIATPAPALEIALSGEEDAPGFHVAS